MKKIIFILAAIFPALIGYSQSNEANNTSKKLSVEESNKLNGVAQPTINGIPYSQYKAQQDALQQKAQQLHTNNVLTTPKGLIPIAGSATQQAAVAAPQKAVDVKGTSFDPIKPVDKNNKTEDAKTTTANAVTTNSAIIAAPVVTIKTDAPALPVAADVKAQVQAAPSGSKN